jgi:CheY-like chemotaxis protein
VSRKREVDVTTRPVLVVEDDDSLRTLLLDILAEEGYRVLAARDGAAGLALVRGERPAVIFLDTYMHGMDGAAFLAAYRALPGPHAPVVLLSAATDAVYAALTASGPPVSGVLPKPFDLDDVLALVERHTSAG